ncbi:MAG: hypothetical protein JKX97_04085, partial [Candidatus Lindowbacteria bacterium]|nr:hypothetical protein [Candidatus Lindowbacteria bacterium]
HGESDGFQFYVYRTVKSGNGSGVRRYRTNIALLFNEPLGLDLVTYPEGFFEKIGKTIFGLQDIILGNPELDAKIMVKGSSESEIQCRFSNEELLETILGLYKECPATRIDDYGIRVREIGRIVDAEKAKKIMSLLAQTAKGIEASK